MLNRSKTYLAPLVLKDIEEIPLKYVLNSYIFSDFECLEPILYLEVEKHNIELDIIERLLKNSQITDCFTINDNYLITITLSSNYHFEYLCFKRGHYSWFTEEAKRDIVNYLFLHVSKKSHNLIDQVKSVFMRDPMLKKYYERTLDVTLSDTAELGNKMDEEEETFQSYKYENFKPVSRRTKADA